MYLLMKKCVLEVSGRAGQCVRRVGVSALEALARRPRGQQLLRQVDRMLDVGERMARWAAGGDGTTHSTYFPVSAVTMVSLSVVILPTMVVSVIIMSIPVLPFALPLLVCGPIVNLCYDGTISTFLSCFPTPSSTAIAIRRRRRELRAIRYNGVRDMHLVNEGGICDSILAKIFVWWPVAVLAIVGQLMGLGGPYTPAAWAPSPLKKGDLEVSPRKRKLYELEIASNEGKQSDTEPEEMQELEVDSDSSDAEEVPDPLETTIMEILSRAVQESDTTVKDDGSAEVEDPDYEPEEYISDDTETEEVAEEDDEEEEKGVEDEEEEEKGVEDEGEKESEGKISTLEDTNSVKVDDGKSKTDSPTLPQKLENGIPIIRIEEENGEVATLQEDEDSEVGSPANNDYATPQSSSDEETLRPRKIAEELNLFLASEAASSSSLGPEEKLIKDPSKDSPSSKNLDDSALSDEQDSVEGKDGAKSKPLFGGLFRRRSNDKQS